MWVNSSRSADWLVEIALQEDGAFEDLTARTVLAERGNAEVRLTVRAKEECVVAGLWLVHKVYDRLAPQRVKIDVYVKEGENVKPEQTVLVAAGPAHVLLAGERVALNFLGLMSAVATSTHNMLRQIDSVIRGLGKNLVLILLDTRKTLPGYRSLMRWAVRVGGGRNHRYNLRDAIMVKDNHIAVMRRDWVKILRNLFFWSKTTLSPVPVYVEVESVKELKTILDVLKKYPVHREVPSFRIMLDNFDYEEIRSAVELAKVNGVPIELSGGINPVTINRVVENLPDDFPLPLYLSSGYLTRNIRLVDFSAEIE